MALSFAMSCLSLDWQVRFVHNLDLNNIVNAWVINLCMCPMFLLQPLVSVPGASTWRCCMRCRWVVREILKIILKKCQCSHARRWLFFGYANFLLIRRESDIVALGCMLNECGTVLQQCINYLLSPYCICSYWTSCRWFTVHASSSTVCKLLRAFGFTAVKPQVWEFHHSL